MTIYQDIDFNKPLSPKQKEMLKKLAESPVIPDEDCPALTPEELREMYRISDSETVKHYR